MACLMKPSLLAMIANKPAPQDRPLQDTGTQGTARMLPAFPVFVLQPLLGHIVRTVSGRHPELIARLGENCKKRFLIDPHNLPFFLLLRPDPAKPQLMAYNRGRDVRHDVHISGTLVTLLSMIDGRTDGDALFFNRKLIITGDTEAVVALRNALDNMDATLAEDVAACFGPLSRPVRAVVDLILAVGGRKR